MTEDEKERLLEILGNIFNSLNDVRDYTSDEDPCASEVSNLISNAWDEADNGVAYAGELEHLIMDIECTEDVETTVICPNCMTRITE